jgi:DNA-binding CsgD family transcriptional regulator
VHIRGFKNQFDSKEYFLSDHDSEQIVVPQWPFSKNAFEVAYSATYFESSQILFSTYIEGMDEGWSDFVAMQRRQFTNIREGNYVFWVKARNIHGVETEPVGFRFEVLPPWYRTIYAKVAYVIVVVLLLVGVWYLLIWLMERSRMVELKKQQERFRSKEEKLRNAALENEKEMIRLRNEKLRNEMVFKEKELANSTMHIIQKNDFLLNIKEELQKINRSREISSVERKVNEIVRKIDKDIDNESQWEVFELHLEHVHADFINRLQQKNPDLSSREQKLCAYLRMDMSSKEISSLMNISVRAVENNRYKLRKKMGLDAKDNLSDFIMGI